MAPAETLEVGVPGPTPALSISLSPQGHVHVEALAGSDVTSSLAQIARHFERGDGHGVFRLGAAEPETPLPGVLGFWRDVGRAFVVRLWLWWLRSLGLGGCLADDMGVGKTLQIIALLVLLKKKGDAASEPSLLVVRR
jgi:hypothetical protein